MKKIVLNFCTYFLLVLSFIGCNKKEKDPQPTQPSGTTYTFQISASINGTAYSQSYCYYREKLSFLTINNDSVTVNTYPHIGIQVINSFDTGAYDLSGAGAYGLVDLNAQTTLSDAYGTLNVITRTDSVIVGTFSFTCTDSTKVTNGSFTGKKVF